MYNMYKMFKWIILLCAVLGLALRMVENNLDKSSGRKRQRELDREDREFMEWLTEEADDDEW